MNVAGISNTAVYKPCYMLNQTTGEVEVGSYNYTSLMENIQKQIEEAKLNPPKIGNEELSEAEIEELAEKYDPQNMSQSEYDEFIQYLEEKGVLSRLETSDLGMSRITIMPGYFEPAYIWASSSGMGSSVHTLSDVGGNALQFAQIMTKWEVPGSSVQIRQGAYSKVLEILNQMNAARGSTASNQTSSTDGNASTTLTLGMDLSYIQLAIDRIKSERIQSV